VATLYPFRALRPTPADAPKIAAVPYDVVSADEARALAAGNRLSFLHVSRAEIDLPPDTDPYADVVYRTAAANFDALKKTSCVVENEPSVYLYRLRMGSHEQIGLAACYSIDEYDRRVIKKHERTRRDKEDDRTRHMLALGAQTGPVFLTYRASADVDRIVASATKDEPLFDFETADRVCHTVWRVEGRAIRELVEAFAAIPALYIADGHHRAASAARTRADIRDQRLTRSSFGDEADYTTFLAVAFPHVQVQILPYNRAVKDLGGLSPPAFLEAVRARFEVEAGPATPKRRGEMAMYFQGGWHTLKPRVQPNEQDTIASLDVSVLQDQLLAPILNITDVRTDKRIDFVGGMRGTAALETLVNSGQAAVAWSLCPVSVEELMAVADADDIMPPKSTWFEPKLRDGLLIHLI
jgi:uncharacterized protein (DUF1015 family)